MNERYQGEPSPDAEEFTVDELARSAGVLTSTVRMYQNKGLLPPPERRGRLGVYSGAHLRRLRLIARLQERGFSLAAIKELVDGLDRGATIPAVLGLGTGPSTWTPETPTTMSLGALAAQLPPGELDADVVRKVVELGLVRMDDGGTSVVVSVPSFLRMGREIVDLGIPMNEVLDEYEQLRSHTDAVAARFTEVFRRHLWDPFVEQGMPAGEVERLIAALETFGPLAEAVVVLCLRQSLQRAAEEFAEHQARLLGVEVPAPGAPRGEAPGEPR